LLEWSLTSLGSFDGRNVTRTATGVGLGLAYGLALVRLLGARDFAVILVGVVYGGLAGTLLAIERRR
jgi:hypothetical protein